MKRLFLTVFVCSLVACGGTQKKTESPVVEQPAAKTTDVPVQTTPDEVAPESQPTEDGAVTTNERYDEQPFLMLDEKDQRGSKDLVVVAVGDVQQATKQWPEKTNELKEKVLDPTRDLLATGDLTFMNLENPISNDAPTSNKTYAFTSPPERLEWYLGAHFNLFSLANNHSADAGQKGIDDTIKHLEERATKLGKTVYHAGTGSTKEEAIATKYITPEGKDLTVAFIAVGFSKSSNVGQFWDEELPARITEAKTKADIVLVSVHAGKEYQHVPRESEMKLYRSYVDAGADAVIGHHTHCVQPVEHYKNGIILYSLGNFVFASRTIRHRKMGAKLYGLMTRIVFRDGKLRGAQLIPTWVNNSEDWKLPTGEKMPNANFTPQILTGPFAEKFFVDFEAWSKKAGTTVPTVIGDTGFIPIEVEDPNVASRM